MHDGSDIRISVIIPTLNEQKLIERLLSQFSRGFRKKFGVELIVSDGGSNDATLEIAGKYADRIVRKEENRTQNISQGRNAGAKDSLGDVLVFLNADTAFHDADYSFGQILESFASGDTAAIACRINVFPEEEKFSDRLFHGFYNLYVKTLNRFFTGMGRGECHIVSRKSFLESGGYDENLAAGEDFDLYRRLRRSGKIIFRDDLIVYESPRRYRKYGYYRVIRDWSWNALSVIFLKRSYSKKWEAVR